MGVDDGIVRDGIGLHAGQILNHLQIFLGLVGHAPTGEAVDQGVVRVRVGTEVETIVVIGNLCNFGNEFFGTGRGIAIAAPRPSADDLGDGNDVGLVEVGKEVLFGLFGLADVCSTYTLIAILSCLPP